jgi:RNA polymerase-binding transcription factor DksA
MPETNDEVETKELDLADIKKRLLKLKAQLEHDRDVKEQQVAESGDDLVPERGGIGNHMADDANETAEQETMLTLQHNIQRELEQVNQALARLENGTYGKCLNCGRTIPPARLEARPYSLYDIDCQQLADRGKL